MAILGWIGALVVLLLGALILNGVGQSLEGRDTTFIHFGWVTLILLIGGALFPFWGWTSTGWVLGVAAAWSIVPPLAGRLLGDGVPSRQMYHGDPPGNGDAEDSARPDDGERPSGHVHTMTIFESAESAHAHIVATKFEDPSFELAISDGMTFAGDQDLMGAGMAMVLDAILGQGYVPHGFEQREGYRLYRYGRME